MKKCSECSGRLLKFTAKKEAYLVCGNCGKEQPLPNNTSNIVKKNG